MTLHAPAALAQIAVGFAGGRGLVGEEVVQEGGLQGARFSRQEEGFGPASRRLATCPQKNGVLLPGPRTFIQAQIFVALQRSAEFCSSQQRAAGFPSEPGLFGSSPLQGTILAPSEASGN